MRGWGSPLHSPLPPTHSHSPKALPLPLGFETGPPDLGMPLNSQDAGPHTLRSGLPAFAFSRPAKLVLRADDQMTSGRAACVRQDDLGVRA